MIHELKPEIQRQVGMENSQEALQRQRDDNNRQFFRPKDKLQY
jgi:hypothetical protein